MKRALALVLVALVALIFFYLSRFWYLRLWDRDGLLGFQEIRPQGNLLAVWLRGTDFAPFELLLWAIGVFLILTVLQKLFDLFSRSKD